jgi:hypothetical protein
MKYKRLVYLFIALPFFAASAANEQTTTASKIIKEIRIQDTGTSATYYFVPENGTWQAPGCENAIYAYLDKSSPAASAALSAALTSKASKLPIVFHGLCGSGTGNMAYIRINYIQF